MIKVYVYENGDELITHKQFNSLQEATDWIVKMGSAGIDSYVIKFY